jgi:formylglycine-generating enzyme required for sulfatase activity
MRSAGADGLSLALMDARNRSLGWLAAFDGLAVEGVLPDFDPPWWLVGQAAWFQEYWIARHVQRNRGDLADPKGARLASIDHRADGWFDPTVNSRAQRWLLSPPDADDLKTYLSATLDTTLELLDKAGTGDEALAWFRTALLQEDRTGEALAVLVQALDLPPERCQSLVEMGLWPSLPSRSRRDALGFPGQQWQLGAQPGVWAPDAERWGHAVAVPDFEIDAQPVGWAQFAEFIEDGGYDDQRWWSPAAWDWIEARQHRAPRYVEQASGAVMARRQGRLQRIPGAQSVMHVNAYEADAWCRWAGRRLPSEAEWELAACTASARGFSWGDVQEWVAGSARWFGGQAGGPAALDAWPVASAVRVVRAASLWGSARLRHPKARRFVGALDDSLFVGFRSCAL